MRDPGDETEFKVATTVEELDALFELTYSNSDTDDEDDLDQPGGSLVPHGPRSPKGQPGDGIKEPERELALV